MSTATQVRTCIRCHDAPRVDEYHCARCAAHIEREKAKIERLMTPSSSNQIERIVLADPAYTAVRHIAVRYGWCMASEDGRVWTRGPERSAR